MRKSSVMALSAALGCLMTANAEAATYVSTLEGVITFGVDRDGVFGTPEAILTGDSFVETFTYDTSTAVNLSPYTPVFLVYGTLALTVNGVTITGPGQDKRSFDNLGISASGGNPDPYLTIPADPSAPYWYQQYPGFVLLSSRSGSRGALRLDVTSQSVSPTPSLADFNLAVVPEPSSWALLLSGFLGLGLALRTRRRTASTTA